MHRIDGANATVNNQFSLGNPGAGIPATTVTDTILNAFQEEICSVIEAAGITLDKTNNAQLLAAIRNLGFSTGDGKITLKSVADLGWVMANDGTIGSAASGATTRANADTQPLFAMLWPFTAANAPIYDSTGAASTRGVSAADDFAANKRIALTRTMGRALVFAGAGSGLTSRAVGDFFGEETHTLTQAETPVKSHTHGYTDPGHSHIQINTGDNGAGSNGPYTVGSIQPYGAANNSNSTASSGVGISIQAASDATATGHNNMQPSSVWNVMIKL